jgi:hypothetical protein
MATAADTRIVSPGWIEWFGGDCPVDAHMRVQVMFRSDPDLAYAEEISRPQGTLAYLYRWSVTGGAGDIIAYRAVLA